MLLPFGLVIIFTVVLQYSFPPRAEASEVANLGSTLSTLDARINSMQHSKDGTVGTRKHGHPREFSMENSQLGHRVANLESTLSLLDAQIIDHIPRHPSIAQLQRAKQSGNPFQEYNGERVIGNTELEHMLANGGSMQVEKHDKKIDKLRNSILSAIANDQQPDL